MFEVFGTIPTEPSVPGGIINWVVCALTGLLVWLVKRLVDSHQDILKTMRDDTDQIRVEHRADIKAILEDSTANRKTFEAGFDKIAEAIGALSQKRSIS